MVFDDIGGVISILTAFPHSMKICILVFDDIFFHFGVHPTPGPLIDDKDG